MWTVEAELIALGFIAKAFSAIREDTEQGAEEARCYSNHVIEMMKTYGNLRGHVVRERWLDLQAARYPNATPLEVAISSRKAMQTGGAA